MINRQNFKNLIPPFGEKQANLILNRNKPLTIDSIPKISELLDLPVEVLIQPYALKGQESR
ncbi:hypothetical protein KIH41_09450 [Litoribacter ruber]|uniref:hypothetical protein n=1 Tax=Litoribacter ruber TaxID=702568 RepID=UPI001BDAD908|nr:hypothetical protein [Litoribacter ruber]MBT0811502.1 hypothetical protein [Litoribacter ruber]